MIRVCDGRDRALVSAYAGRPCGCGLTFDDAERSTVFPHPWLRPAGYVGEDLADMVRTIPAKRRRRGPVNPTLWFVPAIVVLALLFAFAMSRLLEAAAGCR